MQISSDEYSYIHEHEYLFYIFLCKSVNNQKTNLTEDQNHSYCKLWYHINHQNLSNMSVIEC